MYCMDTMLSFILLVSEMPKLPRAPFEAYFLTKFAFVTKKCLAEQAFEKCTMTTENSSKYKKYKVSFSDHNFVVGPRHMLIPSVYGVCEIKVNGELSYSGNTFIRIRSGKHNSSSAHTHASANTHVYDMKEVFESSNLAERSIFILSNDGEQDEASRYSKP